MFPWRSLLFSFSLSHLGKCLRCRWPKSGTAFDAVALQEAQDGWPELFPHVRTIEYVKVEDDCVVRVVHEEGDQVNGLNEIGAVLEGGVDEAADVLREVEEDEESAEEDQSSRQGQLLWVSHVGRGAPPPRFRWGVRPRPVDGEEGVGDWFRRGGSRLLSAPSLRCPPET